MLNIDEGEDDLFINRIARKNRVGVVVSPESMTQSDVVDNFLTWRALKYKYLYTKQFYKGGSSLIFGFETFSKYLFYLSVIAGIVYGVYVGNLPAVVLLLLLLIIRFAVQLFVLGKSSRMLDAGKYHLDLLFFDLFQPFNNFKFWKYANKRKKLKK